MKGYQNFYELDMEKRGMGRLENYRLVSCASAQCQTLINADDSFNIIGASLLKHYYSVWDIGNQRMGFAPTGKVYAILPRFHFLLTDCYRNRILKLYLVTIYDVLTSNEKNIRTRFVLRFH